MKILKYILIVLVLFSCKKENELPSNNENPPDEIEDTVFNISGTIVFDNGEIADSSQVFLDGEFTTNTDENGEFTIYDLSPATYTMKIKNDFGFNRFIEIEKDITIDNADIEDTFLLPLPVELHPPASVFSTSIGLIWSSYSGSGFREYHIYVHYNSALTQETGTLLHIITDANDTTLTVNKGDFWWGGSTITPGDTYYFRVFVMNEYGVESGSNILEVTTKLWDNEDEFTSNYIINLESSFASQGNLTGITWDGNYYWMLFVESVGGYYDPNIVTIAKYDYTQGTILDEFIFDDSNLHPKGIAWDGTYIWVGYGDHLKSLDIDNGIFDKTYYLGEVAVDLAYNDGNLAILDTWNEINLLNPVNGTINATFTSPFVDIGYSGEAGIAYRDTEMWIINRFHYQICIVDDNGNHIGIADVDFLLNGGNFSRMPMCFVNDKLAIVLNSQVRLYTITSANPK